MSTSSFVMPPEREERCYFNPIRKKYWKNKSSTSYGADCMGKGQLAITCDSSRISIRTEIIGD
jgi:hypothetical protein